MIASLLIFLAALNLSPDQQAEAKILREQIADQLGRVGRYESDLSVVMWNFVHVAHIVIDNDEPVVYYLGGWDPSIIGQIFEFVSGGSIDIRTLTVQERIVVSGQCPDLKEAVNALTSRFTESLEWLPFETEHPKHRIVDGDEVVSLDGADFEIRGRVKGGLAAIWPDGLHQTPLYRATHNFFMAVSKCANSSPTTRLFQHAF